MINLIIKIPGRENIHIENIIFDYNGTIAINGKIKESIKESVKKLTTLYKVYVLTADTYKTAEKECKEIGIILKTFPRENAGEFKKNILLEVGKTTTICVGNGFNDIKMCKESILSIGVIEEEGMCSKLFLHTDIVVKSIESALNILLDKNKIIATLRN